MQLRIAICDDEKEICSQVEEYIRMVLRKKDITCETDIFQYGEALCDEMKRTRYDIVFLDIEMPGMDGMVEYLRNKFPNLEVYRLHEGFKYTLVQQESN